MVESAPENAAGPAEIAYDELFCDLVGRHRAIDAAMSCHGDLVRVARGDRWVTLQRGDERAAAELVYVSSGSTGRIQIWTPISDHRPDLALGARLVASQIIAFLVGAIGLPPAVDAPRRLARGSRGYPVADPTQIARAPETRDECRVDADLEVELELVYEWDADSESDHVAELADAAEDAWFSAPVEWLSALEDAPPPPRPSLGGRVMRLVGFAA